MADSNTRINAIKIKDLPKTTTLSDDNLLLQDDTITTHKFLLSTLVNYIKNHSSIFNFFAHQESVNAPSGIAPLDENKKIPSANIKFGKTSGTVYDGSEGAALETSVNAHILDKNDPHDVTKEQVGLGNVENKTAQEILNELTADDIISKLGYVPGEGGGETYGIATETVAGLIKSGTDITVDSNGNVSIKDDSHNHSDKMCTISGEYATFVDFWIAINNAGKSNNSYSVAFKVKDTGLWSAKNSVGWIQGFAIFQNVIGTTYDIGGSIIMFDSGTKIYKGKVSGTSTPTVTWNRIFSTETGSETRNATSEPTDQTIGDYWCKEY